MLEDRLHHRDIKPTTMRILVLKELIESSAAISLKDLEARFERADKVTLYRTLKTFEENKLIHSIDDGSGSVKYALCEETCNCSPNDQHVHFHCTKCDETFCFNQTKIPATKIPFGFEVSSAAMVFQGICASCS